MQIVLKDHDISESGWKEALRRHLNILHIADQEFNEDFINALDVNTIIFLHATENVLNEWLTKYEALENNNKHLILVHSGGGIVRPLKSNIIHNCYWGSYEFEKANRKEVICFIESVKNDCPDWNLLLPQIFPEYLLSCYLAISCRIAIDNELWKKWMNIAWTEYIEVKDRFLGEGKDCIGTGHIVSQNDLFSDYGKKIVVEMLKAMSEEI